MSAMDASPTDASARATARASPTDASARATARASPTDASARATARASPTDASARPTDASARATARATARASARASALARRWNVSQARADTGCRMSNMPVGCNMSLAFALELSTASSISSTPLNSYSEEFEFLMRLTLPMTLSMILSWIESMVVMRASGYFGIQQLAALVNASAWSAVIDRIVTCNLPRMTMLVSAAFGNENIVLAGIWLQTFTIFSTGLWFVTFGCRFLAIPIFYQLGMTDEVISSMRAILWYSAPGSLIGVWHVHVREWFTAHGHVMPELIIDCVCFAVSIPVWFKLVFLLDMGIAGVALCGSVLATLKFVLYLALTWAAGYHKVYWQGFFCREVWVRHRWDMIASWFPLSLASVIFDDAQNRVMSMYACWLGPAEAVAYQLVYQVAGILCLIGMPLAHAIALQVGLHIAMGKARAARFTCFFGMSIYFVLLNLGGMILVMFSPSIAYFVVRESAVVDHIMDVRWAYLLMSAYTIVMPAGEILVKQGRVCMLFASPFLSNVLVVPAVFCFVWVGMGHLSAMIYASASVGVVIGANIIFVLCLSDWKGIAKAVAALGETSNPREAAPSISSSAGPKDSFNEGVTNIEGTMPLPSESQEAKLRIEPNALHADLKDFDVEKRELCRL